MFDRFRDLEKAGGGHRLDVVLMATVSSFESLKHPTRHDLTQFSQLFLPLFQQAGRDTRRTAAAALSRCPRVPHDVVRAILEQEIGVAATFLANAAALDDREIADIVATHPPSHARALARRRVLSDSAVDALVATGDETVLRSLAVRGLIQPDPALNAAQDAERQHNEEALRSRLRDLVGRRRRLAVAPGAAPAVPKLSARTAERLNRFAEEGEALFFATALADALGCAFSFAETLMLDISGKRLAQTLTAIGFDGEDTARALCAFFPHLRQATADRPNAAALVAGIDSAAASADLARRLTTLRGEPVSHAPAIAHAKRPAQAAGNDVPAEARAAEDLKRA